MSVHTSHGVRCGNRAQHGDKVVYHATTQAVKDCFAESGRFDQSKSVWHSTGPLAGDGHYEAHCPGATCSVVIQQQAAAVERERREAATRRYAAWRSIPVFGKGRGYYALMVEGVTGRHPMFFRVERPAKGTHAGKTFVSVQAGDSFGKLPWVQAADVLDQIARDPEAAALLYGREIGRCSSCNRTLTDQTSRERGMGPDCWERWRDRFRAYND